MVKTFLIMLSRTRLKEFLKLWDFQDLFSLKNIFEKLNVQTNIDLYQIQDLTEKFISEVLNFEKIENVNELINFVFDKFTTKHKNEFDLILNDFLTNKLNIHNFIVSYFLGFNKIELFKYFDFSNSYSFSDFDVSNYKKLQLLVPAHLIILKFNDSWFSNELYIYTNGHKETTYIINSIIIENSSGFGLVFKNNSGTFTMIQQKKTIIQSLHELDVKYLVYERKY